MGKVYHLDLDKNAVQGAENALLPGDPGRSPLIAGAIAEALVALAAYGAANLAPPDCG